MKTQDTSTLTMEENNLKEGKYESDTLPDLTLYCCHDKIIIWDPDDAAILRQKYRIVGSLGGCFPPKPHQNNQLSLPLFISTIEAKFVLEHSRSKIFDSSNFPKNIDLASFKREVEKDRETQFMLQKKLKQEQKLSDLDEMKFDIEKGKLTKLEKRGEKVVVTKNDHDATATGVRKPEKTSRNAGAYRNNILNQQVVEADFEQFKLTEVQKADRFGIDQTWIRMDQKSQLTINYPRLGPSHVVLTDEEKLQYRVFCDLHYQGCYITSGVKFGGDFLVYPGDPGIYHSMYIVHCVPYNKELSLTDYSALGRLASSVRKTLLLCSLDENDELVYSSIAWSGIV